MTLSPVAGSVSDASSVVDVGTTAAGALTVSVTEVEVLVAYTLEPL